jgi:murein L,D-transpeptidase YafK
LTPRFLRALLAPAAIAATIALAGCNGDTLSPTGRALAPLSDKMLALLQEKHMDKTSPILLRIFKEESQLEVWKVNQDGQYALLKTYPICRWSGALGPKRKEGDRQAPEGFYKITRAQMNPNSNYYLAFNTGYPNAFDRAWGRTGSELMVHGDCSSRGCYAMTDGQIQEIYALAREAFFGGQKEFQLQAYPFRMTALNMAKHRNNPNFAFWKELKQGYDAFDATRQEPKVAVCEKHYVFDAAPPEDSTKPLQFNPRGKCPVYRLDPTVADAILDHRRQEQLKMAEYIADGVSVVPVAKGADGGMNPVFADSGKLQDGQVDNDGRVYNVASMSSAPAELQQAASADNPQTTAEVPMPERSPLAKPAPAPKPKSTIASLINGLFGGSSSANAAPAAIGSTPAPARTELAAKPRSRPRPTRTAAAPVRSRPSVTTAHQPKAVARAVLRPEPAPKRPPVRQAANKRTLPENHTAEAQPASPPVQNAFTSPTPRNGNGLMAGAQPVMQAGSFDARWSGLR